uniref:TBC1 domain family member 4 n=2 Tax=Biomphalaria glabrata TaxID=6526 RepID=A0A2C9JIX7_BIOGL
MKNLMDKDYNDIFHQLEAEETESLEESIEVLLIGLRQLCERKQKEHTHISAEGHKQASTEINLLEEKTKLFEGFRSKARKSLTTSFETLLRGKKKEDAKDGMRQRSWTTDSEASWASKDSSAPSTPDISPMPSPMSKEFQHDFPSPPTSPGIRRRSATLDSLGSVSRPEGRRRDVNHNKTHSPMKTSFLLATNTPQHSDSTSSSVVNSPMDDHTLLASNRRPSSSWRKAIFNRVCTPQHSLEYGDSLDGKLHNTVEIRGMWKKAILETLLLIRMEKENHDIRARQEEGGANVCRKLDYQELTPCLKEITFVWEQMLTLHEEQEGSEPAEDGKTVPLEKLLDYVKKGVPRNLRGQIWLFLMQQRQMSSAVPDSTCDPCDYDDLLKQLTTHQHAILIDLGRTFPCHPYFAKALGPGQLELFNLLKAYSLLDPEVGYCQGLSFIVGMLLMHMEEISAFHVLKYMMYHLGLRKQFRPNMTALQIKLYQLTRLLHDHYKDVYDHFETHEISPTLYAAPWFLTLFASQFPLGFVSRVFDMIFVQGIDCLFKVALMLIGNHRALILQCDSFESVVDFLKTTLPEMVQVQMERIINQAFELDITKELQAYEVEYHVLSEEMTYSPHNDHLHPSHHSKHYHSKPLSPPSSSRLVDRRRSSIDIEMIYCMEQQNRMLKNQNMDLLEKLQHAQSQQRSSEHSVHVHQIETEKLKSHIRTLELERGALLQAVAKLKKIIPRDALLQLNLALPPMPDCHSPLPPSKPALLQASTQVSERDFSSDFSDLTERTDVCFSLSNSSTFSDSSNAKSNCESPLCATTTSDDSLILPLASATLSLEHCTADSTKPSSPVQNTSPCAGGDPSRTLTRTPPRITLPMPHLHLSTAASTEAYPSRSISNKPGSIPNSTPLTPEERRRTVKVVVQQSPTSCQDKPSSGR